MSRALRFFVFRGKQALTVAWKGYENRQLAPPAGLEYKGAPMTALQDRETGGVIFAALQERAVWLAAPHLKKHGAKVDPVLTRICIDSFLFDSADDFNRRFNFEEVNPFELIFYDKTGFSKLTWDGNRSELQTEFEKALEEHNADFFADLPFLDAVGLEIKEYARQLQAEFSCAVRTFRASDNGFLPI